MANKCLLPNRTLVAEMLVSDLSNIHFALLSTDRHWEIRWLTEAQDVLTF